MKRSIITTTSHSFKLLRRRRRRDMVSEKLMLQFVLTFLVVAAAAHSHASADSMQMQPLIDFSEESSSADNKVNLSVYYESLCPYCANFMVNHLVKIFQTDLINIVNLRLIPWGNTQIQPNDTWICQHGVDECRLDVIEACAINSWPKLVQDATLCCLLLFVVIIIIVVVTNCIAGDTFQVYILRGETAFDG